MMYRIFFNTKNLGMLKETTTNFYLKTNETESSLNNGIPIV